ncbi:SCO family protein [Pseudocnuella soli]|uniref:SCO family protein n=1 Tax=Pseudocnuella soli TaxID=2502779 RepID=UPI001052F93F|nr:SCO family protein [Pseudocnuella soli]
MNKKTFLGIMLVVLVPVLLYLVMKEVSKDAIEMPRHYIFDSVATREEKGKLVTDTVWHQLPEFNLTNQLGQQVGWKDLEGKIVVANFFFTRCPTICPQLTKNVKLLQDNIKSSQKVGSREPDFIHFLSFSVDSERDSVHNLKRWADRFQVNPENWWLLTGPKKEIYDLSINDMKLGLVDGQGIDTSFFHTDYLVLIDRNRNIRGYYHGLDTTAVAKLSRDIIYLYLEKDPKRKSAFAGKFELLAVTALLTIAGLFLLFYVLKRNKQ